MEKLSGDYIAGFVDGEGCFALKFRRDVRRERKNAPIYFYWDVEFAIVLRGDDKEILDRISHALECGTVRINKKGDVRYSITDINDLSQKIIPFFEQFKLHAKKKHDFKLWKEAVQIFLRNQRMSINSRKGERGFHKVNWNENDIRRLKEIHEEMKVYKSNVKEWKWLK